MNLKPTVSSYRRGPAHGLFAVSVLLLVSGCIGGLGRRPDPFDGGSSDGTAQLKVEVQNLNFNDLTVYAVRRGQRIRLGNVTGKSDGLFEIEWNFALPVEFRIDVVGGQSCRVGEVAADPGATVWIQVPANFGMSPCRAARR